MSHASLLVIHGHDQGTRFQIQGDPIGIGRGARNEVRLFDTEVSRQHALIQQEDERFILTDRGSSNGTFVNGRAISQATLADGDRIQVGRTTILFSNSATHESKFAASVIDFVGHSGAVDSSKIVSRVSHDRSTSGSSTLLLPGEENHVLYRIVEEAVSPSSSIEQMLGRVLDLTMNTVSADRGCVLLRQTDSADLLPVAARRRDASASERIPVSQSIVDYVLRTQHGVRTSDARQDTRFETGQSILQAGIREALCVPMQGRYESIGVIYVDTTTAVDKWLASGGTLDTFNDEHLRLLVAIGRQAALAIENNRYQEALVKAERLAAMGQTIALLSHHIKNILQGVRGGSYLIDMGLGDHDEELIRKGWKIVEKNQTKIYQLVMDMLTFSKERVPSLETDDILQTIRDVCELMQPRAEECHVQFECPLPEEPLLATFDAEAMHRAILNVVTNAIDAVEDSPNALVQVDVALIPENDHLRITVADNGPGIPPDRINAVFNVFESTKGARGTGIGLAVSRKILREHGGEISIESQPNRGCRFILSWPRFADDEHRHHDSRVTKGQPPSPPNPAP